jgi:hypothetical protein
MGDTQLTCPATKVSRTRGRPDEPDLACARDRALLLVGFVAALRRSELAVLTVDQVVEHPNGLVLTLPRSKANQPGNGSRSLCCRVPEPRALPSHLSDPLVPARRHYRRTGLPRGRQGQQGPGPGTAPGVHQHPGSEGGHSPQTWTPVRIAHSLRSGFVTYAHPRGASDRGIAHQTRRRSLATLGTYVHIQQAWTDNAATTLRIFDRDHPRSTPWPCVHRRDTQRHLFDHMRYFLEGYGHHPRTQLKSVRTKTASTEVG